MKTIKKLLAGVLAIVIMVLACSCTMNVKTTISASGKVVVKNETYIEKAKIDQFKVKLASKTDTVLDNEETDQAFLEFYFDQLFEGFEEKTIDDVKYLYYEGKENYTLSEYNETLNLLDYNTVAEVTTKDFWVYSADPIGDSVISDAQDIIDEMGSDVNIVELFEKLDIDFVTTNQIKFPYVITDTNCEKVDDYTINEPADKKIYYVITEESEADWTKAEDKEAAIKEMALEKLKPTKPTEINVAYASKTKFAITFDAYVFAEGDGVYGSNYRGNKFELQVKIGNGDWKTHKVYKASQVSFGEINYKFTEGKKYRFRIRSIRESKSGAFETMYSSYKVSGEKQAAYLSNCAYVKATSPKKGQLKVAFTKAQKVKVWGYRIRYSTDKNFKKGVKAVEVSASKMPKTIKGLKSGKTYYVQVRKYVKGSYGQKVYGENCKAKKVKVK